MQGHQQFTDKVVTRFRLSERVPHHNLYRRLSELLNWDFLQEQTQARYSHTGQPSLDPVAFFKLLLVSRLKNLVSDRRLVEHCGLRLDTRYFLGYEVDEDLRTGVISHVQADSADRRDSVLLERIVAPLHQRLLAHNLPLREVAADTNYSNGLNYALLEARGLTPWIPVFGQYKPDIEGFTYEAVADCFTRPAGKQLRFKNFDSDQDGRLGKRYAASSRDCRSCARKATCAPKSTKRQLIRTAYAAPCRRTLTRQQSWQGQRRRRLRQRPIEPVFGSLLAHYEPTSEHAGPQQRP